MNALAFVMDGLYYGVSDFGYAAYSMVILYALVWNILVMLLLFICLKREIYLYFEQVLVGLITSVFLLAAAPVFGLTGVWTGLFLFMTLRVAAGIWR